MHIFDPHGNQQEERRVKRTLAITWNILMGVVLLAAAYIVVTAWGIQ